MELVDAAALRLTSDLASDPVTGAMLGMHDGEAPSGNGHGGAVPALPRVANGMGRTSAKRLAEQFPAVHSKGTCADPQLCTT
jgi:hypothetical protein